MADNQKFVNPGTARMEAVQKNDWLSYTSYIKVLDIQGSNLKVIDQRGVVFGIQQGDGNSSLVNQTMHSASYVAQEVVISRTQLVEKMLSAGNAIMTATYYKQVDPEKAFEQVKTGQVIKTHAEQKKDFKKALEGERRILTGYILKEEGGMGRTLFYDLEAQGPRLVDHRSIETLILKGIKYIAS